MCLISGDDSFGTPCRLPRRWPSAGRPPLSEFCFPSDTRGRLSMITRRTCSAGSLAEFRRRALGECSGTGRATGHEACHSAQSAADANCSAGRGLDRAVGRALGGHPVVVNLAIGTCRRPAGMPQKHPTMPFSGQFARVFRLAARLSWPCFAGHRLCAAPTVDSPQRIAGSHSGPQPLSSS